MYLPNSNHQQGLHRSFRADGTLAGTGAQLILPVAYSRCMLMVMNTSASVMFLEHGPARFTATISGGVVTAVTITNPGFGYTVPPVLEFRGGFQPFVANASWNGLGLLGSDSPTGIATQGAVAGNRTFNAPASAHCVLTGGAVTSVVIDTGGYGYINPPEIVVKNEARDPFGCAAPTNGAGGGICLPATNGFYYVNGTSCWTDQVALIGSSGASFVCEYML
jgi:hypothetical protein